MSAEKEKIIRTIVGKGMLGIEGVFLSFYDAPKLGGSIRLIGMKIEESELTDSERANLNIAHEYGHRTRKQLRDYMKGGRICVLQTDLQEAE